MRPGGKSVLVRLADDQAKAYDFRFRPSSRLTKTNGLFAFTPSQTAEGLIAAERMENLRRN